MRASELAVLVALLSSCSETDAATDSGSDSGSPAACPACSVARLTCHNGPGTESITVDLVATADGCEARSVSGGAPVFSLICSPLQMCTTPPVSCHAATFENNLTWPGGADAGALCFVSQ